MEVQESLQQLLLYIDIIATKSAKFAVVYDTVQNNTKTHYLFLRHHPSNPNRTSHEQNRIASAADIPPRSQNAETFPVYQTNRNIDHKSCSGCKN
mmetsp:Transcript_26290/g.39760  ORF Transcript_26290/g.39760 Transcript_26290/m.39760 type:complete len:95 (-) Transcript_26290:801-1085(-)